MDMKERLCGLVHQARLGSCGYRWEALRQTESVRVWAARRRVRVRVARRRINELRWLRVGTGRISETRGLLTQRSLRTERGGFDLGMRNAEFGILEKRGLKSDRALRIPQLRDEVWNSFHAKAEKEFQM